MITRRSCRRDQKRNRKLTSMSSSVERRQQMWVILSDQREIWIKFSTKLKKQTAIMAERAEFIYRENPRWRRPPYWISKKCQFHQFGAQMHQPSADDRVDNYVAAFPWQANHILWNVYIHSSGVSTSVTSRQHPTWRRVEYSVVSLVHVPTSNKIEPFNLFMAVTTFCKFHRNPCSTLAKRKK